MTILEAADLDLVTGGIVQARPLAPVGKPLSSNPAPSRPSGKLFDNYGKIFDGNGKLFDGDGKWGWLNKG